MVFITKIEVRLIQCSASYSEEDLTQFLLSNNEKIKK